MTRVSRQSGGRFRGTTETTRLIDRISVRDTSLSASGEDGTIEAGAPLRVTFSRHFAQSIREGFYQILDAELLGDLKQPTARSLYRILHAHRVGDDGSLARELPVIMAAWREATGLSGQRPNNVKRTLDGAHAHLIAAKYLRGVAYEGSGEATRITYAFQGETDPELVQLLLDMKVTRPVAESLVTEHAERIRETVRTVRVRVAEGFKPRSLGATMVDAVRNPEKYATTPTPTPGYRVAQRQTTKSVPEAQQPLLPLTQAESLGMIRSILKVKLGRAPDDGVLAKLGSLSPDVVDRLAAAARGQEDLIAAVEAVTGKVL